MKKRTAKLMQQQQESLVGGILRWRRTRRRRNQSPPWLKKNSNQPQQPPQQLQPHPRAMPSQQGKLQHSCYNKSNNNHDTRTMWRRTRSRNSEIERRIWSPLVVQQQSTMTPAQRRQVVCTKDAQGNQRKGRVGVTFQLLGVSLNCSEKVPIFWHYTMVETMLRTSTTIAIYIL